MKLSFATSAIVVLLAISASGCAPTDGPTDSIPSHVQSVIDRFAAAGLACNTPSVYLNNGNISLESAFNPDTLTCNESDTNVLGDKFDVFESDEEAASYFQESCNDRPNGWYVDNYMLSRSVAMDAFEQPVEKANQFAAALGSSQAHEVGFSCAYSEINW